MKKQRVSSRKKKVVAKNFEEAPRRLEAQLVAKYGFSCVNDMLMFSVALDKTFKNWCNNHVVLRGVLVWNKASLQKDDCRHFALRGTRSIRPEIIQLHRHRWVHVYHILAGRDCPLQEIHQLASTFCIAQPDDIPVAIHSQVSYIEDGHLDNVVRKTPDGHFIRVDHSRHTPEQYEFLVNMRWE
jgi:hypothetical protein